MKKLLVVLAAIICAATITVRAQDSTASTNAAPATKMHKLTAEQQKVMDAMLAKYDTNHDGKLDKTERAAMTPEDLQTMKDAGLIKVKKPKKQASSETSTNAPAQQ